MGMPTISKRTDKLNIKKCDYVVWNGSTTPPVAASSTPPQSLVDTVPENVDAVNAVDASHLTRKFATHKQNFSAERKGLLDAQNLIKYKLNKYWMDTCDVFPSTNFCSGFIIHPRAV